VDLYVDTNVSEEHTASIFRSGIYRKVHTAFLPEDQRKHLVKVKTQIFIFLFYLLNVVQHNYNIRISSLNEAVSCTALPSPVSGHSYLYTECPKKMYTHYNTEY
jgi:hypothetical protein